jgi:hypothetical protein
MIPPQPPSLTSCPFFQLPLEIRLKIYKELLVLQRSSWLLSKKFPPLTEVHGSSNTKGEFSIHTYDVIPIIENPNPLPYFTQAGIFT